MKVALFVFGIALSVTGCTSFNTPRPDNWPESSNPKSDCRDVVGTYVEPNVLRDRRVTPAYTDGGTLDAIWPIFGWYNLSDQSVKSRKFRVNFDETNAIVIDYWLNGALAAKKVIPFEEYRCERGLLKFDSYTKKGDVYDAPGPGVSTNSVEMLKTNRQLLVKFSSLTAAIVWGIVPRIHTFVYWLRFPVEEE